MSNWDYREPHRRLKTHFGRAAAAIALLVSLLTVSSPLLAQDDAAISQGFQTDSKEIEAGALVSIEPSNPNGVRLANTQSVQELVGVVNRQALIELSGDNQQIQVVTSGTTSTLVSNINGDIKTGDKITASPINGVGMRTDGGVQVVGTAQADFSSVQTVEKQVKDKNGAAQFVRAGLLPVQVNITYFAKAQEASPLLPGFLQDFANSVAGRDVSQTRVIISALVLAMGFVSMGVLLYASVRSSIISIGRNPLSEKAVRKSLLQVALTAVGILIVTLVAIYLILRI